LINLKYNGYKITHNHYFEKIIKIFYSVFLFKMIKANK